MPESKPISLKTEKQETEQQPTEEKLPTLEEPSTIEQPSSTKERRKGRKRKSQVRFSPSPTREESDHHADVEDNIVTTETPPTGRRRTPRPTKMLDVINKVTTPLRNRSSDPQPEKKVEERFSKRKRRESVSNQSSDGTTEVPEEPVEKKRLKSDSSSRVSKSVSGRQPPVAREESPVKKVLKSQPEDTPKSKSNSKHNTRHQTESSPVEPEVKKSKRVEIEEVPVRNSARKRSSSRDTRTSTNSNTGKFSAIVVMQSTFDLIIVKHIPNVKGSEVLLITNS